ncbi:hypothetical protein P4O66_003227 [Electrophorus voltai]|uniref:Ig-like domain-containing protein n=1 Tax=Electrophorus voltai TaxID=2609070 RepID=A0AAD9DMI7_9TELE|nr:hypothetical protein P4O66_003227 [Electrophorus voltai]
MAVFPLLLLRGGVLLFLADFQGVRGQQAFKTEPQNVTARAGATALLKCEVLRLSGSVQWAKDGLLLGPLRSLPGHPRYTMIGDEGREGQYHLQIADVRLEDDSPYECQVSRSKSSQPIISRTVWINVQSHQPGKAKVVHVASQALRLREARPPRVPSAAATHLPAAKPRLPLTRCVVPGSFKAQSERSNSPLGLIPPVSRLRAL